MNNEPNLSADTLSTQLELHRAILRAAMDGFLLLDLEGQLLEVNDAYCRMSGYSEPELLTKSVADLSATESREQAAAHIARIMERGEDRFETRHRRKDGSIIDLEVSARYQTFAGGRIIVFLRDITERMQAELALLQEQELYEDLVNTLPAGAYRLRVKNCGAWQAETWRAMATTQYSLDFASDRFCAILGIARETLAANPGVVSEFIHPDDKEDFDAKNAQAMTDFNPFIWEGRIISNTQTRWVHFESLPRAIDPEIVLWTGIVYDITDLKQAVKELRESKNRLRFALEGSNDGLWDVQMKTGATYISPRSWEILGYQGDEAHEFDIVWSALVHPEDLLLTEEHLRQHIAGVTPIFEVEQRLRTKSGDWKWVLARGKVVSRDEHGEPLRITGTHTDLTDQKKLQEQLNQAHKMESVGRLAGGVAHDFNNMLCVILGHAEMARKNDAVSPKLLDHLEQIQHAAERSADVVRQLLAFARKQTIVPRVLDLKASVASTLKMLRRLIGEEINLTWQPDATVWPVKMDPSQMDQILVNLCVNARDAIAAVGRINIEARNVAVDADFCAGHLGLIPGEYVLLTVSDDGCGMDTEISKKIFEPFFTTKEEGQGTGLGLAMVYGIVKQNAGFIAVDSEPGQGTSFKIYLPRYLGKENQARAAGPGEPVRRGEETVLLVEDEPAILDLGKEILAMQGYHVLAASTPGEAIRIAEEQVGEIHLLITDVVMPEMDGRELTRKLLSLYPGLKRLFMSGYTADVIAHHGVLDEGVEFIQKPFSLEALAAKAREVLDK